MCCVFVYIVLSISYIVQSVSETVHVLSMVNCTPLRKTEWLGLYKFIHTDVFRHSAIRAQGEINVSLACTAVADYIAMIPGETMTSGGVIRFPYSVVVLCLSHNLGGNTVDWPLDITRYYCLLVGVFMRNNIFNGPKHASRYVCSSMHVQKTYLIFSFVLLL